MTMSQSMDENSRKRGGGGALEMTQRQQSTTAETGNSATVSAEAATATTGDVSPEVTTAATGEEEEQPEAVVVGAPQPTRTQSGEQRQEWEAKINELRAKCRLQAEQLMAWRKAYSIEVSGRQGENMEGRIC